MTPIGCRLPVSTLLPVLFPVLLLSACQASGPRGVTAAAAVAPSNVTKDARITAGVEAEPPVALAAESLTVASLAVPGPSAAWLAPGPSQPRDAEPYPSLYRRFGISVGGAFYADFDTTLRLSGAVVGAILDLEDFLAIDSETNVFRLDAHYAFNRRHRIDAAYYDLRRSGSAGIPNDIQVGDQVIPAGQVNSFFNTRIFKVDYRYNFVADERTVIGSSLGFHTMLLDTGISSGAFDVSEQFDVVAPLPLIGLHAAYALDHKWTLSAGVETLRVKLGNIEGFVLDTRLSLDHDTFEHFGWGIGLNSFDLSLDVEQSLTADVEYGYSGVMLYLRSYF